MSGPLHMRLDWRQDVLEVDGVRFEGAIFYTLGGAAAGATYRVEDRGDGVLTLRKVEGDDAPCMSIPSYEA